MNGELTILFEAKERARQRYEAVGMCNTYGKTAEERIALDLAFEVALQQWLKAEGAYRAALLTLVVC